MYYVVVGTYCSDVFYGVDNHSYIMGIFSEEGEAAQCKEDLMESEDFFKDENGRILVDRIDYSDGTSWVVREDAIYNKHDRPVKYCDFDYDVLQFNGKPVFCGGASYIE